MKKSILHLDYETRSDLDLKKVGLHVYAKGKNTDVWCAGYAFDDEPVQLWKPGQPIPKRVFAHIQDGKEVWAHNAPFEIAITNFVASKKHGWPKLSPNQVVCTAVMAYAMGLPGSLEGCSAALGIRERKDLEGSRLMLQLSKPRSIDETTGQILWWSDPGRMERLYSYCIQDVVVERMAGDKMFRISEYEKRLWLLDQKINDLGITVDTKAIFNSLSIVEYEKNRLNNEIKLLTDGEVCTANSVAAMKNYLEFYGLGPDSLDKASVLEELAKSSIDPKAKRILEIRQEASKSSTAKFEPMLTSADSDNRVKGCFQFSGANTRRWAGRRIQLHNLPRPSLKHSIVEKIIEDIRQGISPQEIDMYYGAPLNVLKDCIRSFLTAAPGHHLMAVDFSAIEARVIAWLAGQNDVLDIFRKKLDIYKVAASSIFGVDVNSVNDDQRAVGKVAILALGYQGGVGAFQQMAKGYNVKMEPAFESLWAGLDSSERSYFDETYKKNKHRFDISREEYIASDITKTMWRRANPHIVNYWTEIEHAAITAIKNPGALITAGPHKRQVSYKKSGSFLWCKLPSKGVICYPYPEIKEVTTPWGAKKDAMTYMAEDGQTKKWQRFSTYGGSLVENLTQSFARDVFADSMLRLDEKDYKIVIHTHDEIVCEVPENEGSLEHMMEVMSEVPPWAEGLPIAVSGWRGFRYRK